jgi:hypothetical protein
MRNLKILGLALLAITAVSAISVTAASADELTATQYPATLTGFNEHPEFTDEFKTTAGPVRCTKVVYDGTLKEKATAVTATPTYSECTAFGFPATIHMNGCDYVFRVGGGALTTGTADLVCPVGKEVTVTAISAGTTKCTVHVPAQTGLATVTYSNIGSGTTEEITVFANLVGIKYSHTIGSGLGACPSGSAVNGTLVGKAKVTGEVDPSGAHIGLLLTNA